MHKSKDPLKTLETESTGDKKPEQEGSETAAKEVCCMPFGIPIHILKRTTIQESEEPSEPKLAEAETENEGVGTKRKLEEREEEEEDAD